MAEKPQPDQPDLPERPYQCLCGNQIFFAPREVGKAEGSDDALRVIEIRTESGAKLDRCRVCGREVAADKAP